MRKCRIVALIHTFLVPLFLCLFCVFICSLFLFLKFLRCVCDLPYVYCAITVIINWVIIIIMLLTAVVVVQYHRRVNYIAFVVLWHCLFFIILCRSTYSILLLANMFLTLHFGEHNMNWLNKLNQLDVTLWKFFIAQHVSNVITLILRSRRLYVGVLFCFGVYWCIGAVRLE